MTGTTDLDAAWRAYGDRIKAAGERITGDEFPTDPRMRAEGYRFVSRLAALAHQIYVDFGSSTHPVFLRNNDDISPFGAPNVDNNYYRAMVDPAGTYRITGNVAGQQEVLFSVQDGEFIFGKTEVLAELSLEELELDGDGRFELHLGGRERTGNWLPLGPDAVYINIREFVVDWEHDRSPPSTSSGSTTSVPRPASPPRRCRPPTTWRRAGSRPASRSGTSTRRPLKARAQVNDLPAPMLPVGGAQNMLHGACTWDLEPDQALLVEFEPPEVSYWGNQTYIADWMVPLDFADRVTSLNHLQLHVDDDGKVRIVLSESDPGVPNWLDTSGLRTGLVTYRYVRPRTQPTPTSKVIAVADVRDQVHSSTPTFSADDRHEQIAARRRGVARRFRR